MRYREKDLPYLACAKGSDGASRTSIEPEFLADAQVPVNFD